MSDLLFDPEIHRRRQEAEFKGGPLKSADFELDALYYGVQHVNRQRLESYRLRALIAALTLTESPDRPALLDAKAWIRHLYVIDDPSGLPSSMDPAQVICFNLDWKLALSYLPKSRRRAFVLFMEGWAPAEIARLMGRDEENQEGYSFESVLRVLREASNKVRGRSQMDAGGPRRLPRVDVHPTSVIAAVEREIEDFVDSAISAGQKQHLHKEAA